ncbi:hypothetical protein GCM10010344_63910 [Streptomyces bluensis]|nr:hypothetical protein GCM10010344_63910 [Streptomyces bluensis]
MNPIAGGEIDWAAIVGNSNSRIGLSRFMDPRIEPRAGSQQPHYWMFTDEFDKKPPYGSGGDCRECDASSGPHTNLRENAGITVQIRLIDSRGRTVPGSYDRAGWRNYNDAEADCE